MPRHIVLGSTGHVGAAVTQALLARGELVTIVTRSPDKARDWEQKGARTAVVDVQDVAALRQVLRHGERLFFLNPPAPPSTDTVAEEHRSLAALLAAVDGSGVQKIVAESTYGAQPAEGVGDLGVLYDMERALAEKGIPTRIIRAAYYMSNWDASLRTAQQEGKVHTFFPVDMPLAMVAPQDLGQVAARLHTEPVAATGLHYVEGPKQYTAADVAAAFAAALHKPVEAVATPRAEWTAAFMALGFSAPAAQSYAKMTGYVVDGRLSQPDAPERGAITLQSYVHELVRRNSGRPSS